jgi:hypothetical protein
MARRTRSDCAHIQRGLPPVLQSAALCARMRRGSGFTGSGDARLTWPLTCD